MKISYMGLAEIGDAEDMMLSKYLDSGNEPTIGIGSTKSDIKDLYSWPWDKKITIQQAVDIYIKSLAKYEAAVNKAIKVPLRQHEYDALVSFIYNCGTGATNSTVFRRVNAGEKGQRIRDALLMWVNDNGKRVQGLVNRRNREADVFINADYKSKGSCDLIEVNPTTHKPVYSKSKRINLKPYVEHDAKDLVIEPKKVDNMSDIDLILDFFGYTKKRVDPEE